MNNRGTEDENREYVKETIAQPKSLRQSMGLHDQHSERKKRGLSLPFNNYVYYFSNLDATLNFKTYK